MQIRERPPMIIAAWKYYDTDTSVTYRVQISNIVWRDRGAVAAAMTGWNEAARGWNGDGEAIIIFSRDFPAESDWLAWVDSFPAQITEKKYWGEKVKIITHNKNKPSTLSNPSK
jgi:hypothetical protein